MSWLLSSIVGSSKPALSFNLGEAYGDAWGAWTHCRGTSKARCLSPVACWAARLTAAVPAQDSPPVDVSVFKITGASASDPKLLAARNGVKRLRTVRTRAQPLSAACRGRASSARRGCAG